MLPPGSNATFENPGGSGVCATSAGPLIPHSPVSDASNGQAPYWSFDFEASTTNSILSAVVVHDGAQILGVSPPTSHCFGAGRVGTLAPAPRIEDSPGVAHSMKNLTSFLGRFPATGVLFALDDVGGALGRVSGTAVWLVEASPCFTTATAAPGFGDPEYMGGVNDTTSRILIDQSVLGFGSCEVPGTLAPARSLGSAQVVYAGSGYGYRMMVSSLQGTVTPSMFHPMVFAGVTFSVPAQDPSSLVLGFTVANQTGSVVAQYNFISGVGISGASVPLLTGYYLELLTSAQIPNDSLVLVANPPTTGQIGISLP